MISRSSRGMVFKPITCCSVMRWASTPRGMKCPQHKKTEGAFRPLERGLYISLEGINGAMDFHRIDELMEPLVALPDRFKARLAVPLPG
jgi:hypothetical protein